MTTIKLTSLAANVTPSSNDILYIVEAPGTTPVSKKVTVADLSFALDGVYNAKHFGAVGNGVTNDTVAIQAAIDAAAIAGGLVYYPPGIYSVTNLVWKSYVSHQGAGSGSGSGTKASVIRIKGNGAGITSLAYLRNISIRDICFDNASNTNSGVDIFDFAYGLSYTVFENIFIAGKAASTHHGLRIRAKNPDTGLLNATYENTFIHLQSYSPDEIIGKFIYLEGDAVGGVNNNIFIGGNYYGWNTLVHCWGIGNIFQGMQLTPIGATPIGFYFYGDGEVYNNILLGVFIDGVWTGGAKVKLESLYASDRFMISIIACPGIGDAYTLSDDLVLVGDARYSVFGPSVNVIAGPTEGTVQSAISSGGQTTFYGWKANYFETTLTENTVIVLVPPTTPDLDGVHIGAEATISFKQAASGGPYTVTFGSNYFKLSSTAYTMTPTASRVDVLSFVWNGSRWLEKSRIQDITL
jgi:Pectate lyase superfamily protein